VTEREAVTGCRRGERQSGRITLFGQHGHRDRRPAGAVGAVPSGESCPSSPFIEHACVFPEGMEGETAMAANFPRFSAVAPAAATVSYRSPVLSA